MKEQIFLTGLLLGTNHGRITTNQNQRVFQWNGSIPVHLQSKSSKFKVKPSAGKVMLTVFCDSREVLLVYIQKLAENVNSASYCGVLLKFRDAIRRKLPGQLPRGALFHHDNATTHTARATQQRIQELQWEHRPYSPDLAPSDLHLFTPLKKNTLVANV
jgi:hypothetical protein